MDRWRVLQSWSQLFFFFFFLFCLLFTLQPKVLHPSVLTGPRTSSGRTMGHFFGLSLTFGILNVPISPFSPQCCFLFICSPPNAGCVLGPIAQGHVPSHASSEVTGVPAAQPSPSFKKLESFSLLQEEFSTLRTRMSVSPLELHRRNWILLSAD